MPAGYNKMPCSGLVDGRVTYNTKMQVIFLKKLQLKFASNLTGSSTNACMYVKFLESSLQARQYALHVRNLHAKSSRVKKTVSCGGCGLCCNLTPTYYDIIIIRETTTHVVPLLARSSEAIPRIEHC
jgi:hypothetical protein